MFTYVNPAVAVIAGVALLGEPLTTRIAVSFALILGGCLLATSRTSATAAAPGPRRPTPWRS